MKLLLAMLILLLAVITGLAALRFADRRAAAREWRRLAETADPSPARFDPAMVADLPEPARRYLSWAILPGTPLARVAEITMEGRFGLGTKADPKYLEMQAQEILSLPEGFVWKMQTGGPLPFSGSDSGGWTRFGLFGLIPVARAGGDADHRRSAFGRLVSEAVWTPAAVLPGPGITWQAAGPDTARLTLTHDGMSQSIDLTLTPEGAPTSVVLQRWSNANPEKAWRLQPFGAHLSDHREVAGFRIPFHNEAGNFFGTEDYFPFFIGDLTSITYRG